MSMVKAREYRPFRSTAARERYLAHYEAEEKLWPTEFETREIESEYGTTFVRISGLADAPPLVLLPGATSTSLCWRSVAEALSVHVRMYALDAIYDSGRSVPTRKLKKIGEALDWLDGLLDALGLTDNVNIMGLSYGGCVTAEYALHAPERLAHVVWLSPAMTVAPISKGFIKHIAPCAVPLRGPLENFARWVMPFLADEDEEAFEVLVDELWLARRCYGPMSLPGGRVLTDEELAGIDVPVLYLVGDQERVVEDPQAVMEHLSEVAPQIRTATIERAGHDAIAVRPDEVSRHVLELLGT